MKLHFRFSYLLLTSIALIVFACTNYQDEEAPEAFSVDTNSLAFSSGVTTTRLTTGETRSIKVTSGSKWDVTSMPEWINLESINLSGVSPYQWKASFSADVNNEYNREGEIVITSNTGSNVVLVNQEGRKGIYKQGDVSLLRLNEVYGAGADEEKFFELYNASDYPIKLTGVTISKDESNCWTGIDGEVVPAKGFFAIIGAKGTTPRGFSSGFSAKKSVYVQLFDNKGNQIDAFQRGDKDDAGNWGVSITNYSGSWSRVPDGTGKWMRTDTFTPGAANSTAAVDDDYVKN